MLESALSAERGRQGRWPLGTNASPNITQMYETVLLPDADISGMAARALSSGDSSQSRCWDSSETGPGVVGPAPTYS